MSYYNIEAPKRIEGFAEGKEVTEGNLGFPLFRLPSRGCGRLVAREAAPPRRELLDRDTLGARGGFLRERGASVLSYM